MLTQTHKSNGGPRIASTQQALLNKVHYSQSVYITDLYSGVTRLHYSRELRTELQVLLQRISLYRYFYEHIFKRDPSTGLGYKVELQNYRITELQNYRITELQGSFT